MIDVQEKLTRWIDICRQYQARELRGVLIPDEIKFRVGANIQALLELDEVSRHTGSTDVVPNALARLNALHCYAAPPPDVESARKKYG